MADLAGWYERSVAHFETSIAAHTKASRVIDAARVTARLGLSLDRLGRAGQGIALIREALASLEGLTAPPEVLADLHVRLGTALVFSGHTDEAAGPIEETLRLAQHYELDEPYAYGLIIKGVLLSGAGRDREARLLYEGALEVCRIHGITQLEMIAENNLADQYMTRDLPGSEEHARASLALARRWGLRGSEAAAASNLMYVLTVAGRLEEAERLGSELLESGGGERPGTSDMHVRLAFIEALRGNLAQARDHLSHGRAWAESDDVQQKSGYAVAEAAVLVAEGKYEAAHESAQRAMDLVMGGGFGVRHEAFREAFPVAVETAIRADRLGQADQTLEMVATHPRGEIPPFLRAQIARARALLAGARGETDAVEDDLAGAEVTFRELGYPYWVARALLDRAEWLAGQGRLEEAAELAGEAAATFQRVGTAPMIARARALLEPEVARATT